jgi:hypothetical protein
MEDLHHVRPPRYRTPPRLKPTPSPREPRWQDLSPTHQEELLRLLGRMLTDRLAGDDGEVTYDCH